MTKDVSWQRCHGHQRRHSLLLMPRLAFGSTQSSMAQKVLQIGTIQCNVQHPFHCAQCWWREINRLCRVIQALKNVISTEPRAMPCIQWSPWYQFISIKCESLWQGCDPMSLWNRAHIECFSIACEISIKSEQGRTFSHSCAHSRHLQWWRPWIKLMLCLLYRDSLFRGISIPGSSYRKTEQKRKLLSWASDMCHLHFCQCQLLTRSASLCTSCTFDPYLLTADGDDRNMSTPETLTWAPQTFRFYIYKMQQGLFSNV